MSLSEWTVLDLASGEREHVGMPPRTKRRGRKPSVKTIHERLTKAVKNRAALNSVRFVGADGRQEAVVAGKERISFSELIDRHRVLLRKRKVPQAAEEWLPVGQAAEWYADVILCVPRSGQAVARQIARLCGDDSQVTVPLESLADAVGRTDRTGRLVAYTQRGIDALTEAGWLEVETTGPRGNQLTTYYLMPGERSVEWFPEDEDEWIELKR